MSRPDEDPCACEVIVVLSRVDESEAEERFIRLDMGNGGQDRPFAHRVSVGSVGSLTSLIHLALGFLGSFP